MLLGLTRNPKGMSVEPTYKNVNIRINAPLCIWRTGFHFNKSCVTIKLITCKNTWSNMTKKKKSQELDIPAGGATHNTHISPVPHSHVTGGSCYDSERSLGRKSEICNLFLDWMSHEKETRLCFQGGSFSIRYHCQEQKNLWSPLSAEISELVMSNPNPQ